MNSFWDFAVRCLLKTNYWCSCSFSGVEPWSFEQHLGQAIFIPAGCPFQSRNLQVRSVFLMIFMVVSPRHFIYIHYGSYWYQIELMVEESDFSKCHINHTSLAF